MLLRHASLVYDGLPMHGLACICDGGTQSHFLAIVVGLSRILFFCSIILRMFYRTLIRMSVSCMLYLLKMICVYMG